MRGRRKCILENSECGVLVPDCILVVAAADTGLRSWYIIGLPCQRWWRRRCGLRSHIRLWSPSTCSWGSKLWYYCRLFRWSNFEHERAENWNYALEFQIWILKCNKFERFLLIFHLLNKFTTQMSINILLVPLILFTKTRKRYWD